MAVELRHRGSLFGTFDDEASAEAARDAEIDRYTTRQRRRPSPLPRPKPADGWTILRIT